jgi:hypothetical protein
MVVGTWSERWPSIFLWEVLLECTPLLLGCFSFSLVGRRALCILDASLLSGVLPM